MQLSVSDATLWQSSNQQLSQVYKSSWYKYKYVKSWLKSLEFWSEINR